MGMNKHKRNLDDLRRHLGRDTVGLALLDAVSRDLCEQRKRISALEESEARVLGLANTSRMELDHAQSQIAQFKADLEMEQAKRIAADNREKRTAARIAQMESDLEAEDENPADAFVDDTWSSRVMRLFKDVRRAYRRAPKTRGTLTVHLDDLVVDYTGDEFMNLGKLVALYAVIYGKAVLASDRLIRDASFSEDSKVKILKWMRPLIKSSALADKVWGPM